MKRTVWGFLIATFVIMGCGGGGGGTGSGGGGGFVTPKGQIISIPAPASSGGIQAINNDGSVVVGQLEFASTSQIVAAIWNGPNTVTEVPPNFPNCQSILFAVSPNGLYAVGTYYFPNKEPIAPFFWSKATGSIPLPPLDGYTYSNASNFSVDDSGLVTLRANLINTVDEKILWLTWSPNSTTVTVVPTPASLPVTTISPKLPTQAIDYALIATSPNGHFVAGYAKFPGSGSNQEACIWNASGIPTLLGYLTPSATSSTQGYEVSNDGSVAVGISNGVASSFIWTKTGRIQNPTIFGYALANVWHISGDGKYVTGTGKSNGQDIVFVAPVPKN